MSDALRNALAFALVMESPEPNKHSRWCKEVSVMCDLCKPNETVDQAAVRILAAEVRRITDADKRLLRAAVELIARVRNDEWDLDMPTDAWSEL